MTSADYDSIIRWSTDSIDIRHFSYLGSLRAREGRDESSVSMDIDDGPATEISSLIWRVAYRRAKGLPIDDLELPDLSGFFGGDEEAEPESEASIAAPDESTLPAQDFGQIPEALAKYAEADESAEDFRRRAKGESMAAYRERREGYVAAHRDTRNGNRVKLAQHDDALAYLLAPAPDLDTLTEEARAANPDLFSPSDDITALQSLEAERDEALERLAVESEKVSDLRRQLSERDAEPPPLSPDPVKHMIPEEIRKLMQGDETLPQARQRLWPILNAELGELKNQEALFNKTIPRRAEVEQIISILARLGEG